jgi:hypothetical protein
MSTVINNSLAPALWPLVSVDNPPIELEPSIMPALVYGPWTFEGFFDRLGTYYERITRDYDGFAVEGWYTLA